MTEKKKLKRAIRKHAKKTGVSYSTERRNIGVTPEPPKTSPTPEQAKNPMEYLDEVLPQGLSMVALNEWVTIFPTTHTQTSLALPIFTVAYAIPGVKAHGIINLKTDRPTPVVFARKTPKDSSGGAALLRARREYPELDWAESSGSRNGATTGEGPPYAAVIMTKRSGGTLHLDNRVRGGDSLQGLLRVFDGENANAPEAAAK